MPLIASRAGGSAGGFGGLRTFGAAGDVDVGSMFPLGSVTLSATTASITFSSIPSTYTHLQIRGVAASTRSGGIIVNNYLMRLNSDTANNYRSHYVLGGYSSSAGVSSNQSGPEGYMYLNTGVTSAAGGRQTGIIIDILDYKNTNKFTTARTFMGYDVSGTVGSYGGTVALNSTLWRDTSAVTSITLLPEGYSWIAGTSFALYGIKGA